MRVLRVGTCFNVWVQIGLVGLLVVLLVGLLVGLLVDLLVLHNSKLLRPRHPIAELDVGLQLFTFAESLSTFGAFFSP